MFYGWVGNVNRIFSDRSPIGNLETNVHLLNVTYALAPFAVLTGYYCNKDFLDAGAANLSNENIGGILRVSTNWVVASALAIALNMPSSRIPATARSTTMLIMSTPSLLFPSWV